MSSLIADAADSAGKDKVDFNSQIRPLLAKHCYACHGGDVAESSLRLDHRESAVGEADSGMIAILPGDSAQSELLRRVRSHDESDQMPPEGKRLDDASVALIEQWIEQGAEYTPHWSFQPLSDPPIPTVADNASVLNPVDAFVLAKLQAAGLHPNTTADARTLVRRLYYNTLGLPPSAAQVDAFVEQAKETTHFEALYEETVDSLLANPAFGERWGRNWLDVVRYAETNSFERDGPKPNAWKYRDYVIASINSDKPYDRFVTEQLAGDELEKVTEESLIATGYYRLGLWDDEPADPEQAEFDGFDDLVTVTGQGLLGLTLNCARCHDHKIDPISQRDYYSMVAFFRDVTTYGDRGDQTTNSQIDLSQAGIIAKRKELNKNIRQLEERKYAIEQTAIAKMDAEYQRAAEGADRDRVVAEKVDEFLDESLKPEYSQVKSTIESYKGELASLPAPDAALGLARCLPNPPDTFVLARGSPQAPTDKVEPTFVSLLSDEANQYQPEIHPTDRSAGRRLALAKWITSENNWLTARVIVNRVWQHHFGRGIVRSSNNFGQLGDVPTHPELLDYLANELIRHDWNLKPIHRLIMTSHVYKLASVDQEAGLMNDPRNNLYWRFDPRRLSAEEMRDSMLKVTDELNLNMGGPSFYPDVSDEVKAGQSVPGQGWGESTDADKARRSAYIYIKRSLIPPELSVFDFPETDGTCEARFLTTQAAQSLNLLNGRFARECAADLANRTFLGDFESDANLQTAVSNAVRRVYQREGTAQDYTLAKDLLNKLRDKHSLDEATAWQAYCLVLLNTNEFLYLD